MNTGLDCDLLGGVGQGSDTVNIARTHACMYARTGAAAPHVMCSTLAKVLLDDAAMREVWGIQTQRSVDCAKPKVVEGTGIPGLWSQIDSHTIYNSKSGGNGDLPACVASLGTELNNRQDRRGRGKRGS